MYVGSYTGPGATSTLEIAGAIIRARWGEAVFPQLSLGRFGPGSRRRGMSGDSCGHADILRRKCGTIGLHPKLRRRRSCCRLSVDDAGDCCNDSYEQLKFFGLSRSASRVRLEDNVSPRIV